MVSELSFLQQFQKLFRVKASLVDDRFERSALEVAVVHRQGDAQFRTIRVFQDVMTAAGVMNKKTCSLQRPKDSFGLASREAGHVSGARPECAL